MEVVDLGQKEKLSWWGRVKYEAAMSDTYSLEEPCGGYIDAIQSFAPDPINRTRGLRIMLVSYDILTWFYDMIFKSDVVYMYIYLTHWIGLVARIYLILSLVLSCRPSLILVKDGERETLGLVAKLNWEIAAAAISCQAVVVIMYWFAIYDGGPVEYINVWRHGLIFLTVLVDAYLVGRVPIRVKQLRTVYGITFSFLLWSVIHSFSGIGNGEFNSSDINDEYDDDAIYSVLSWKNNTGSAAIYSSLVCVFLVPICFLSARSASMRLRRMKGEVMVSESLNVGRHG